MKRIRAIFTVAVFALGAVASAPAVAWHHGGHVRFGVFVGPGFWYPPPYYGYPPYYYPPYYYPPYYYPPYYYPPYYYPPVVTGLVSPPSYIEQGGAQPAPAPFRSNWWYYCADAKVYYPYVKQCPGGWQRVAPQPPL